MSTKKQTQNLNYLFLNENHFDSNIAINSTEKSCSIVILLCKTFMLHERIKYGLSKPIVAPYYKDSVFTDILEEIYCSLSLIYTISINTAGSQSSNTVMFEQNILL